MIDRLALALERCGAEPTFDDVRDILWLASHLPPARALPAEPAEPHDPPPPEQRAEPGTSPGATAPPPPPPAPAPPVQTKAVDDTAEPDDAAGVFGGGASMPGSSARRIRLPGVGPLPGAMEIARALRPLGRRRPFGPASVLDEVASAERIAETQLLLPVLVARRERWFDIVLAVEDTPSLLAWKATVGQLQRLLERHGGFRAVLPVTLTNEAGAIAIRSANGVAHSAASMTDRHGRRLVIVVADCTSAAWHDGTMGAWLAALAVRAPVAIAQPLPQALWSNTALGFVEFSTRAGAAGAPTAQLHVVRPRWAAGEPGAVIPVFALQPESVARWAKMVMATGDAFSPAALLPLPEPDDAASADAAPRPAPAPLALLAAFRAVATPDAQQLAACLSVVKPLTMPVMRLIQGAMLPGSEASALAQVLISGLLVQTPSALPTPEDQAVHEMDDAVRAQLAGTLRRSEWLRVNLAVQRFIEAETGLGFDFMAYLEDALGDHEVAPAALPFARFARTLADRFRAPGAPQAGARARQLEEAVVGRGLTVRAHRLVSTTIQRLKWSPDGRLMVLHAVGVDILASRTLAAGPRVREGPHVVEWLVHGDDRATLEPWFAQLESQAERQSGEPFSFRMTTYERKPSNEVVEARDRLERASASVTRLIAVTRRSAASGQQALPAWLRSLTSLRGPVVSTGWSPVPLDGDRVEPALPDWLRGWVGLLEQRPDSPATAAAISALIGHVHADERTEDPGRILDAAWGPGSERAELASLRRAAGESVIIDVVQGDPASAPRWLGAPSGPRQEPVDFDVHPVSGNFAVAYPNGEVWAWRPGADRQSLQVPREKAAAIRWSADGGVLGCATPDGFFGDMVSFSPSSPARK